MRVATWNVNSLKARMEAVEKWLDRAAPDILLMQETKLGDGDAPAMAFGMFGYDLVHHGEGRWNGVAIALRHGLQARDVVTNFGDGPVRDSSAGSAVEVGEEDFDPFDEARMVSAVVEGEGFEATRVTSIYAPAMAFGMLGYDLVHHGEGRWNGVAIALRHGLQARDIVTNFGDGPVRDSSAGSAVEVGEEDFDPFDEARMVSAVVEGEGFEATRVTSIYAPNGRVVGSPFYLGKLRWFERLRRWLDETRDPAERLIIGGDFNVTPAPIDVWSEARAHGGTHVSEPERAAVASLCDWGLVDGYRRVQSAPGRFSWWDYRAGMFHRNEGMRIDLLLVTRPVGDAIIWAEIDREARKGPPIPSDHAPVAIDLETPGKPFDPGWEGALARIAARTRPRR